MNRYPIILDTDPGLDDTIAIAVIAAFAKDRLDTVITSYGNVSLSMTTHNFLRCCNLFDLTPPYIIQGADKPLLHDTLEDASQIHGADGLAGITVAPAALPIITENPIKALYERIKAAGTVDYITLGPLTNLALLLQNYPDIKQNINTVITMGGGFAKGNVTPYAEFNIYCDADAAKYVFDCGLPVLLMPLNATHQVALSLEDIDRLTRTRSVKSGHLRQILQTNYQTNTAQGDEGCIVHDACAVIAYLFPEAFRYQSANLTVVTEGVRSGETLTLAGDSHRIAKTADVAKVFEILAQSIA